MKKRMIQSTDLYQEAERRVNELEQILSELEESLNNMPPGKIHIVKTKNKIQYYLRQSPKDKSGTYISKSDKVKIKKYLQKQYNEKIYKIIKKEISILKAFLNKTEEFTNQIQQVYSTSYEEIKSYIIPLDMSNEDYIKQWNDLHYEKKNIYDNEADYITNRGEIVRSKTEIMIANTLEKYQIPYKYECPLILNNGVKIHPDFTILDVKRRKIWYWEHRGMMDDRAYLKHTVQKLRDYRKNGIYLGNNLIITEETSTSPLGIKEIEGTITAYLL